VSRIAVIGAMMGAMPDKSLPIVFRTSLRTAFALIAAGAVALFAATLKLADIQPGSVRFFHLVTISGPTAGWLFLAVGVVAAGVGVMSAVGRCPTLEIGMTGLALTRCGAAPLQIPWRDLDRISIVTIPVPRSNATFFWVEAVEKFTVVTKDGKSHDVGPVGKTSDIDAAIRRVAARMGHHLD
jgi:hypothetical protein